jgi:hypothetical protein
MLPIFTCRFTRYRAKYAVGGDADLDIPVASIFLPQKHHRWLRRRRHCNDRGGRTENGGVPWVLEPPPSELVPVPPLTAEPVGTCQGFATVRPS